MRVGAARDQKRATTATSCRADLPRHVVSALDNSLHELHGRQFTILESLHGLNG